MELRKVKIGDVEEVMVIFSQARRSQRESGFVQWGDNYPSIENLNADIKSNSAFVIEDNGELVGYVAITTYDAEYERFPELWSRAGTYAVLHRIAISDKYRGKGFSRILFDLAENMAHRIGAEAIRIDTGVENLPMEHILAKRNYVNLGPCEFSWGLRVAYEKSLK